MDVGVKSGTVKAVLVVASGQEVSSSESQLEEATEEEEGEDDELYVASSSSSAYFRFSSPLMAQVDFSKATCSLEIMADCRSRTSGVRLERPSPVRGLPPRVSYLLMAAAKARKGLPPSRPPPPLLVAGASARLLSLLALPAAARA